MGSTVDPALIDETKPVSGSPTTQSVRDNFAEIKTQLGNTRTDIEALQAIAAGLDWQHSVLAQQNNPPGAPSEGERYLIGPSPTGAWAGSANNIVEYVSANWSYLAPSEGMSVNVEGVNLEGNTDTAMLYNNGTWANFGSAVHHEALQGLLGGAVDDHYHVTAVQHAALVDANAQLAALHTDGQPAFNKVFVNDGFDGGPAFAFNADSDTGMFRSGGGEIAFAANGTLIGKARSTGFASIDGSGAAAGFGFINDPDTGMFRNAVDELGFIAGGVHGLAVYSTGNVEAIAGELREQGQRVFSLNNESRVKALAVALG